jgi:hypothetical protein
LSESFWDSLAATEPATSGVETAGAGDSVRSALTFFFLADLDSVGAGGFWMSEAAIFDLVGKVERKWCYALKSRLKSLFCTSDQPNFRGLLETMMELRGEQYKEH